MKTLSTFVEIENDTKHFSRRGKLDDTSQALSTPGLQADVSRIHAAQGPVLHPLEYGTLAFVFNANRPQVQFKLTVLECSDCVCTGAGKTHGEGQGRLLKGMSRVGETHSLFAGSSVGKNLHCWTGMEVTSGPNRMLRCEERVTGQGGRMQSPSIDTAGIICLGLPVHIPETLWASHAQSNRLGGVGLCVPVNRLLVTELIFNLISRAQVGLARGCCVQIITGREA